MGLDMYLYGKTFNWGHETPRPRHDGFDVQGLTLEIGYWRKHPNLHGAIVQMFAGGVDKCQRINLSAVQLRALIDAVKSRKLPHTSGFFFGESGSADEQDTIAQLEGAVAWLECATPNVSKEVYYQASW